MFEGLSGTEKFFLFCAVLGGGVFILRSVMMFIGLGGDDMSDAAVDISDADGAPSADFKMVSLHGITAFLMVFGLVGFLVLRNNSGPNALTIAATASLATGLVTMVIIAKLFSASRKLQSDGTIHPKDAIGSEGSVYLEIRPGEIGKVQVSVNGALKIYDARVSNSETKIKTGERIKVVEAGDVLIVEKI